MSQYPLSRQCYELKRCLLWVMCIRMGPDGNCCLAPHYCIPLPDSCSIKQKAKHSLGFFFFFSLLLSSHSVNFLITSRNVIWLRKGKRQQPVKDTMQFSNWSRHFTFLVWRAKSRWLSPKQHCTTHFQAPKVHNSSHCTVHTPFWLHFNQQCSAHTV